MAKVKAVLRRLVHLVLSPEALAVERPLLKRILLRYGISAAALGGTVVELANKLLA